MIRRRDVGRRPQDFEYDLRKSPRFCCVEEGAKNNATINIKLDPDFQVMAVPYSGVKSLAMRLSISVSTWSSFAISLLQSYPFVLAVLTRCVQISDSHQHTTVLALLQAAALSKLRV